MGLDVLGVTLSCSLRNGKARLASPTCQSKSSMPRWSVSLFFAVSMILKSWPKGFCDMKSNRRANTWASWMISLIVFLVI